MAKRRKTHGRPPSPEGRKPPRSRDTSPSSDARSWLFGLHAVRAALANPERRCHRLFVTQEARQQVEDALYSAAEKGAKRPAPEIADRAVIEKHLPEGAVHQGAALQVDPLESLHLEDLIHNLHDEAQSLIVVVDQGTDPRNIGAILRSAAAFGAEALIVPDRHAPEATGVMAKAASGALESVPMIRVTNLTRALEQLKEAGHWTVGLDGDGQDIMGEMDWPGRAVLVLGAEGKGLRRLTRENCDFLARIPMTPAMESLNLSNAAAIALYEAFRQKNPNGPSNRRKQALSPLRG